MEVKANGDDDSNDRDDDSAAAAAAVDDVDGNCNRRSRTATAAGGLFCPGIVDSRTSWLAKDEEGTFMLLAVGVVMVLTLATVVASDLSEFATLLCP